MSNTAPLLEIRDLGVAFQTRDGPLEAVRGVNLTLTKGKVLAIVGESGSGKSVSMMAVMGLLPPNAIVTGSVRVNGQELLGMPARELRALRGKGMAMIFQDPLTSLNPVIRVGDQIIEMIRLKNRTIPKSGAKERAIDLLRLVSIPEPEQRINQYPHEFSGGMRQRVMIAMATANDPALLIADEPTTALDATVQAQIMQLLARLQEQLGIGLVLITHDLGVVAGAADSVSVMYSGRVVERGGLDDIFYSPQHPYTRGLLASLPNFHKKTARLESIEGNPPSLTKRSPGCAFSPRCPLSFGQCETDDPALRAAGDHHVACHAPVTNGPGYDQGRGGDE